MAACEKYVIPRFHRVNDDKLLVRGKPVSEGFIMALPPTMRTRCSGAQLECSCIPPYGSRNARLLWFLYGRATLFILSSD
jgi:hypothetical protein